jgi:hypothetical protein
MPLARCIYTDFPMRRLPESYVQVGLSKRHQPARTLSQMQVDQTSKNSEDFRSRMAPAVQDRNGTECRF